MIFRQIKKDIRDLPKYTSLIRNLVSRDLKIKYRASIMGYLWSMVNPLMMIITYIIAFKYILKLRMSGGVDYRAVIIVGITLWTFSSQTVTSSAMSILASATLLQKVSFPRIIPVISNQCFYLVQHLIVYPILFTTLIFLGISPSLNWLYIIPILVMLNIMLFGLGLLLSTMMIFFRDVQHFLAITMSILFWFTPIIYDLTLMGKGSEKGSRMLKHFVTYTPFTPFIQSAKNIFCMGKGLTPDLAIHMAAYSIFALVLGSLVFYRYQHNFVEEI